MIELPDLSFTGTALNINVLKANKLNSKTQQKV